MLTLKEYIPLNSAKVQQLLTEESTGDELKIIFEKYKNDDRLWNLFNQNNYETLIEIPWNNFRRALKLTEDIPSIVKRTETHAIMIIDLKTAMSELDKIMDELQEMSAKQFDRDGQTFVQRFYEMKNQYLDMFTRMMDSHDPFMVAKYIRTVSDFAENLEALLTRLRPRNSKYRSIIGALGTRVRKVRNSLLLVEERHKREQGA